MEPISLIIEQLKKEWASPRIAKHNGDTVPFSLCCNFGSPLADKTTIKCKNHAELRQFWQVAQTAKLFEDCMYGQWGLEILSANDSFIHTSEFSLARLKDYRTGDLIFGKFLGDSDLLLIRCDDEEPDYGSLLVVLPLDPRKDWPTVGKSFSSFLHQFVEAQGAKFWE